MNCEVKKYELWRKKLMNKIAKKISATVMAGVVAISLAMSVSAGTVCNHPHTTKVRMNQVSSFSNAGHTIEVVVNGILSTAHCSYYGQVYACSYVCDSCNRIVSSAGYEQVEYHRNKSCPRYNEDGIIIVS